MHYVFNPDHYIGIVIANTTLLYNGHGVRAMVFNATFNNISVISWQSVLLVEEIGGPGEIHSPVTSH
jgi:hypothetical protein